MRAIIQKSGKASVEVEGEITGKINNGLVILLGVTHADTEEDINYLVEKITNLRLFDEEGKYFEKSILDTTKELLVISQFTLYASTRKGRRPDFNEAAKGEIAEPIYEKFCEKLREKGLKVETGKFGAMMNVNLVNQGPVTIILDSQDKNG